MANHVVIPPRWADWITENQSLGVAESDIFDILVANGFDPRIAQEKVARKDELRTAQLETNGQQKLQTLMHIYSELWSHHGTGEIDRVSGLSGKEFFRWYYALNRPVVLLDLMNDWPALKAWSLEYLKARCGAEYVEVMSGRSADPNYEVNAEIHKTRMRLDQYVDLVAHAGSTNDFYMVANNRSIEAGGMRILLDDIRSFNGILDPGNSKSRLFLWFGPAGTVTPLHHDTMNILLAQVMGRKKIRLIPSFQTHLVYNHLGVYSRVDCESPDYDRYPLFRNVTCTDIVLQPGEALFIPVGWWHHVRSLDVSMSVSFNNFLVPNTYDWTPGGNC